MRRIPLVFTALGLLGAALASGGEGEKGPSAGDAASVERAKFDGTWEFTSMEYEDRPVPEADFRASRLILKGEEYTLKAPQLTFRGTYILDTASTPKRIDVTFDDGPNQGQISRGIYTLEGDTYSCCMALAGKPRPTAFAAKTGTGHMLQVAKRVKP